MKKDKKLLMYFLALNTVVTSYIGAAPTTSLKSDKIYNNLIKNIEKGKINDGNYKTIEKILNQKNKELKDLYLQNDYIVKPEYLEWQVFFTGFYDEYGKGRDNTSENAKYHTKVDGYYDTNGNYIVTSGTMGGVTGKPYKAPQVTKDINLGVNIPLKGITREPLDLNLGTVNQVVVNPDIPTIGTPSGVVFPGLTPIEFQPVSPVTPEIVVTPVTPVNLTFPGSGNGDNQWIASSGSVAPLAQQILAGQGSGGTLDAVSNSASSTQNFNLSLHNTQATGVTGGASHTKTPNGLQNFDWTNQTSTHAVMKLVGGHPIDINNMKMNFIGAGNKPANYLMLFHTDAHNDGDQASVWNLDQDTTINMSGQKIILYGVQSHSTRTSGSGMVNNGTITADANTTASTSQGTNYTGLNPYQRIIFTTIEADGGSLSSYNRYFYFNNESTGTITLNGTSDILANYVTPGTATGGTTFTNNGKIDLNGANTIGFILNPNVSNFGDSKIILNNPLTLNGDSSIGIQLTNSRIDLTKSILKLNLGTLANNPNSTGNIPTNDSNYVENAVGIYYSTTGTSTIDDYDIFLGDKAKSNSGIIVQNGTLSLNNNSKNNKIVSDGGIGNVLLVASGNNATATIGGNTHLEAKNGKKQTGLFAKDGATINSNSNLSVTGDASIAYILNDASITNTGITTITGGVYDDGSKKIGSVGVAVKGSSSQFTSTGNINIDISGQESTGLFTENGTIDITNGSIKTSDKAFNLFSKGTTGLIKLNNVTAETGQGSLLFYNEAGGKFHLTNVNATIKGGTNSTERGTAFYYTGTGLSPLPPLTVADLTTYFNNTFDNTAGNLTLNMDAGSRLFIVDNVSINLSTTALGVIPGGPNIIGSNYKTYMMYKSLLEIDQSVNLDLTTDDYNNLEIVTSSISNNGQNITGNNANQAALAQENGLNTLGFPLSRNTVSLANNGGNITLNGTGSVGMYASFGELRNTNSSVINVTNNNSIGIYGANGSLIDNQSGSSINISTNGVGIYAEGYKQGVGQNFGTGEIDVTNSGLIRAGASTEAIGIYALNNKTGGNKTDSQVKLSTGSIDVSASEKGIGVFAEKSNITDSGSTITVGKNGLGIYANDSNLTLNGATINLNGDKAVGIYLKGNSDLIMPTATTFNIAGQDTMLFYLDTTSTNVNTNFNVGTVASGASYTIGKISNGQINYTGNTILKSNGILVTGESSEVVIGSAATVTSAPGATNTAAVVVNGHYVPGGAWIGRSDIDGENQGTISLGDYSAGILGKTGANLLNTGTINVGNNSVALNSNGLSGSGQVFNEGTITIGSNSQGIYLKEGRGQISGDLINNTTGTISSTGNNAVAMFADNVFSTVNNGIINLTGDNSIGIYVTGSTPYNTTNNGSITVGNSNNINSPSVGIYSDNSGDTVTNGGTIKSGINSIGIYSNNGTVNQNGVLDTGSNGVGIYATNSNIYLNFGSRFDMDTNGAVGAVGVYGIETTVTNSANLNIGNSNYGFIMKNGSFTNNAGTNNTVGSDSVFLYSTEATTVTNDGNLTMAGSDNVGYYTAQDPVSGIGGASVTNTGNIIGTAGNNNVGIYNYGGTVYNYGTVSVGGSDLTFKTNSTGDTIIDVQNSKYAVGVYGENSTIVNHSGAVVSAGYGGFGIVAKGGTASNFGTIITNGDYSTGMYTEGGIITNESGATINVTGNNAIGMAGKGENSQIINNGIINITGDNAIGMYGNLGTIITNTGTINITGNGQAFVSSDPTNPLHNVNPGTATINGSINNTIQTSGGMHTLPALINAGIIKTNGVLALDGLQVLIKPDPTSAKPSSDPDYDFELSGTSIIADQITTSKPIVILPGFSDGTIADVYKLENVIKASSGQYDFISGSLLWEATPKATGTGSDVYMSRKAFTEFSDGLWFDEFGKSLEKNYLGAKGDGVKIYNKTAYIKTEEEFRHIMGSMAGNIYSNINQREDDISRTFENSLNFLKNSENNTKENVKINIIGGKGKNKEETDGITGYDYTTTGVLALREIERTYKHKFGYSLGYLHTGFEFKDGNESEEWVDTIQLGIHNKYNANNWILKNDLMGRVSFHNIDRNIDWASPLKRSEMNGTYETYSITSDNKLGREFELGKRTNFTPYAGLRAMYVTRPTFQENGLEKLEVEGNDAWSIKPRVGVELETTLPLGTNTDWQFKGTLDFAYEYELADLNERERSKLVSVEDGYHRLSKPEEEKGIFRTKASIGVEVKDRYGIFLTGEYSTGENKEDDYRAGVTLKAVF